MKTFPLPALIAAAGALIAVPVSGAAAGTLLLTAGFGFILHADYNLRFRRVRLPRLHAGQPAEVACQCREPHRLAA